MRVVSLGLSIVVALALVSVPVGAEEGQGGCVPGLASCCLMGVPGGQVQNSGVSVPTRSWLRILIIPAIMDSVKAYQGETAEEYLGVDSLPTEGEGKGGAWNAALSACCWVGVPAGQLMNSGENIPARAFLKLVPYVGFAVSVYDGYKAYGGETMGEYVGGK